MNDVQQQMTNMKNFVSVHLKECCKEILAWYDSGILCDNVVREAASMIPYSRENALSIVESEIKFQSMMKVVLYES